MKMLGETAMNETAAGPFHGRPSTTAIRYYMTEHIEEGFMAFLADGKDGIGAVREVSTTSLVIYIENAGEFVVPRSAVKDVHSQKVLLKPELLDKRILKAIGHVHDSEDPNLVG